MAPRKGYDFELEQLNVDLIKMGALIEEALEGTVKAFENKDYELAEQIIKKDAKVNAIQKEIESKCLSLIMRQQPIAKDLRDVSAALKMVTDMERIGDQSADIAELILRMKDAGEFTLVKDIPAMAKKSTDMVKKSIDAFVKRDLVLAETIAKEDDELDALFNSCKHEVIELLKSGEEDYDICIDMLMISKYFERVGDHAVNICEWVEFNETGSINNIKLI